MHLYRAVEGKRAELAIRIAHLDGGSDGLSRGWRRQWINFSIPGSDGLAEIVNIEELGADYNHVSTEDFFGGQI